VHHALNVPGPVEYKNINLGNSKENIYYTLGNPKLIDKKDNIEINYYEFIDGYHDVFKLRVIPYIIWGASTIGLSEILFYPIEKELLDGKQCNAKIIYNSNGKIINYNITDKNGKILWSNEIIN
jgi:hypothetical protein